MASRHITVTHACMVFLFLSYGSLFLLHVLLFHVIPVFLLYDYFLWYWYSRYWIHELLICDMWNPTSIVPVSRYIVLCYHQSSGPVNILPYHVLYLFLLPCILDISDHKDNLGMGETWRLIRSYRVDVLNPYCLSHCRGRGSAGYRLLLMSSRFPLLF